MKELNKGIRANIIKAVLLTVFSLYFCSITFFTHSHIVGGVTIVHSHFYSTDEEGKATHEHTGSEIQLIQSLSSYFTFAAIVASVLIGLLRTYVTTLFYKRDYFAKQEVYQEQSRLRAPPVL